MGKILKQYNETFGSLIAKKPKSKVSKCPNRENRSTSCFQQIFNR